MSDDNPGVFNYDCSVCGENVTNMPHEHRLTPVVNAALEKLQIFASGTYVCCRHFVVDHKQRVRDGAQVCLSTAHNAWRQAQASAGAASSATTTVSSASSLFDDDETSASSKRRRSLTGEGGPALQPQSMPEVTGLRAVLDGLVLAPIESRQAALRLLRESTCQRVSRVPHARLRDTQPTCLDAEARDLDPALGAVMLHRIALDLFTTLEKVVTTMSTPPPPPPPILVHTYTFLESISFDNLTNNDKPWRVRLWTGLADPQFLLLLRSWLTADGQMFEWREPKIRWDTLVLFFVQGYRINSVKSLAALTEIAPSTFRDRLDQISQELERAFTLRKIVDLPGDARVLLRDQESVKSRYANMLDDYESYLFVILDGTSWRIKNAWSSFDLHRLAWTSWKGYSSYRNYAITSAAGRFLAFGFFDSGKTPDATQYTQEAVPTMLLEWSSQVSSSLGGRKLALAVDKGYADVPIPNGFTMFVTKSGLGETAKREDSRVFQPAVASARMVIESSFGSLQGTCTDIVSQRLSAHNCDTLMLRRRFFIYMAVHNLLLDRRLAVQKASAAEEAA